MRKSYVFNHVLTETSVQRAGTINKYSMKTAAYSTAVDIYLFIWSGIENYWGAFVTANLSDIRVQTYKLVYPVYIIWHEQEITCLHNMLRFMCT